MEPYNNPFWGFSNGGESKSEKKRKILISKIVAYLILLRWSHALRSDQNYLFKALANMPWLICVLPCLIWILPQLICGLMKIKLNSGLLELKFELTVATNMEAKRYLTASQ